MPYRLPLESKPTPPMGYAPSLPIMVCDTVNVALSVAFDPIHSPFRVSQFSSNGGNLGGPQPPIYVYDEQGNLQETHSNQPGSNCAESFEEDRLCTGSRFLGLELQWFSY